MGRFVIVCYKAKKNGEKALLDLLKRHIQVLRQADLVTARDPIFLKSEDNHFLEIFEWKSEQAIQKAHSLPEITALWEAFEACCTFEPLTSLQASTQLFAEFRSVEI